MFCRSDPSPSCQCVYSTVWSILIYFSSKPTPRVSTEYTAKLESIHNPSILSHILLLVSTTQTLHVMLLRPQDEVRLLVRLSFRFSPKTKKTTTQLGCCFGFEGHQCCPTFRCRYNHYRPTTQRVGLMRLHNLCMTHIRIIKGYEHIVQYKSIKSGVGKA